MKLHSITIMKFSLGFLPYILAPVAGLLYLFTAAPFMLWLDAPRFVSAIATLGVANPPEPLYILLAKPFTYLPFGSIIFRLQFFSALLSVLTLLVLYKIILIIVQSLADKVEKGVKTINSLSALFGTATLAFSYQFWSQAQNIETFILVTLIEVVVLLLLMKIKTKKQLFINLSLISLIMGLSTGTNPVIASIIPTILWVMWSKRKLWTVSSLLVLPLIGIVAIILIHLYIPIRAAADPFLNYWRATTLENVISVSTGSGLNVFVPELGRINGFTGSPEIFFKSTWHFITVWLIKFTPFLLPFIVAGSIFLWKKSKYYFIFWFLIIVTNWFFAGLYFSGNQESWFLVSDIAWVVMAALGFYWGVTSDWDYFFKLLKLPNQPKLLKIRKYLILAVLIPLIIWFPALYRRNWVITEDYINNLYRPIGNQKAILFGSSDLFDSVSFYAHDIKGSVYKPNVIPITDNLLYILKWYRDNLKSTTDLKIPDDAGLKYDSPDEYSKFVNDFFAQNIDKYKIYLTIPAARNNFLQVYQPQDQGLGGSLKVDGRFKLVSQGMLYQVVKKDDKIETDLKNFDYQFRNKGFPKNKPWMLEQTYNTELTGLINEYAYSFESMGDASLQASKADDAFKFYQQAFNFNPNNAEIISRLGNYYGNTSNHVKATEYFEKALKIEPRNIGLLFNLAIAYENTGKLDKAIANLNKVLQLSKPGSQIGILAKQRLVGLASGSANLKQTPDNLQAQMIPQQLPNRLQLYQNKSLNLQFIYPDGFTVSAESTGEVKLSNGLTGKDELTFNIYGRKMTDKEDLESLTQNLPFKLDGAMLLTQPVTIPGFSAVGKTYGSGEHLTFLLLMRKNNQGFVIKIYPGDSNKTDQFNQILQSINTLF